VANVLVTGGAGFIGSNFVRLVLEETGDHVVVLDKLTYAGSLLNLADVPHRERLSFVEGDIGERRTVRALFEEHEPRVVVNFAAESHVDRSIDSPGDFIQTNIVGTFELLEAARALQARRGEAAAALRFLHVSTDEVFGDAEDGGAFHEATPYAPSSPYAASKASADHLVRAYFRTFGLPVLITNCSNNFGPYQYPEKLIPLMILNALEGKDLPIYGDGSNVRDWLYVEDHCRGILRVLEDAAPGTSYNIGARTERTNLWMIEHLCALLEEIRPAADNPALAARGAHSYRDLATFVPDRPGHDRRYAIDPSRIESDLGWKPSLTLEEGLRRTVRWYVEHRDWCEKVQQGRYRRERLGLGHQPRD
jgi:dTDP-glucose 4,6-dehydratase